MAGPTTEESFDEYYAKVDQLEKQRDIWRLIGILGVIAIIIILW